MGLFNLFKPTHTVLVIDAVAFINKSIKLKGRVRPHSQLQMLRRIVRFAQRERLEIVAVLTGTPLNKAPAGKQFDNNVIVLYSKSSAEHDKFVVKTALKKGPGAVLVSGSTKAEKLAGEKVRKISMSTFCKAFDMGGQRWREDSRGNGERNNRRSVQKRKLSESATSVPREKEVVNELIDLID